MSDSQHPSALHSNDILSAPLLTRTERDEVLDWSVALFRYRSRRRIGVFYILVSTLAFARSIIAGVIGAPESPEVASVTAIAVPVVLIVLFAFISRWAGFSGFGSMQRAYELLRPDSSPTSPNARWLTLLPYLWPIAGMILAIAVRLIWLLPILAFALLGELIIAELLTRPKSAPGSLLRSVFLGRSVEDWVVVTTFAIALTLPIFFGFDATVVTSFVVTPAFLFAGLKALYDAPNELTARARDPS